MRTGRGSSRHPQIDSSAGVNSPDWSSEYSEKNAARRCAGLPRPRADWRLSAGWLFADASLSTGRRTPQVPRNTATLQATWRNALGVQVPAAAFGKRFERDPVADPFDEHDGTHTPNFRS